VRARQTVLSGATLERLFGERSAAGRYMLWQKLARQYDWSRLLTVRRNFETALLVLRDSPLASG
jgi:hypothetical protein